MDLLRQAVNGDMAAFESLIIQYEKLIYNIAWRIMGNAEDTKDMAQEAILKIYRNLATCKSIDLFKAWSARITHNTCMDELRRRKGRAAESYDAMFDDGHDIDARSGDLRSPSDDDPETALLRKEMANMISEGLNKLSDEHRALLVLRDMQGLTYEEIAEITSLPLGTVKSRISRGRSNLKQILIKMMEHL
ncbi:MAG: sigma-70 family RNA polymerase sigma factor [Defluviitaleaceae bacterium]|nr:sigma-70 family RNA polymerase sigma factor [Defluviitaleaceae bacterium]